MERMYCNTSDSDNVLFSNKYALDDVNTDINSMQTESYCLDSLLSTNHRYSKTSKFEVESSDWGQTREDDDSVRIIYLQAMPKCLNGLPAIDRVIATPRDTQTRVCYPYPNLHRD